MIAHVHDWQPVAGQCARYVCACTAQGYRPGRGGAIVLAKHPRPLEHPATAAPSELGKSVTASTEYSFARAGYVVQAAPTLDETERGLR